MADDFNPQARLPGAENFLNYSRGVRDSVMGDALSGFAQTADAGLQALDRGIAQKASDDVRATVEETDSQLLGVQSQPPRQDPLDKEVRSQVRNLEDKKLAMDAGTIDPQHYYATVQAKVKDIRARYSGYNDTIDSELKKMGIDPNWQRNQILEEGVRAQRARAGAAADAAKNNREFAEAAFQNPKNIIDPSMRAEWANDPNWAQNPTNMSRLKLSIGKSQDVYSKAELAKLEADTADARNKSNAIKTGAAYMRGLDTVFYAGAANGGVTDILRKQIQLSQRDQEMGTADPEHQRQLLVAYQKWRNSMVLGQQQVEAHFSDSPWQWADQKKQVDEAFNRRLEAMDNAIANKDWGILNAIVINNKARVESSKSDMLKSEFTTRLAAAGQLGVGEEALKVAVNKNSNIPDALSQDLLNGLQMDQLSGKAKSLDAMFKQGQAEGVTDSKFYKNGFEQSLEWINGKDYQTKDRLAIFETMFGKENQAWWDNMMSNKNLSENDKRSYYRALTSPQVQASVKELSQYDRQAAGKYYDYVKYMFDKLNRDSVTDINNIITSSNTQQVIVDPENPNHLKLVGQDNPNSTVLGGIFDSFRGGNDAIENWNQGIDALIPLWKDAGIDPAQATQTIMERAGINLGAQHQGNVIDDVTNKAGKAIGITPKGFTGPRGSTAAGGERSPDINFQNIQTRGNPRGAPNAAPSEPNQFFQNLDFNRRSNLGGPDTGDNVPSFGGPGFAQAVNTQDQPNAFQASGQELKELYDQAIKAKDDPELRKVIMDHIKSLTDSLPNTEGAPTGPQSSFQPRGNPAPGVPTDEQQRQARDAIDMLTGIPSFIEAVQKGDAAGAALAAATILPFPGGKVAKAGEKIAEGGAKLIDRTTVEARRAEKGLASAKKEGNADLTRLTPDGNIEKGRTTIDKAVGPMSEVSEKLSKSIGGLEDALQKLHDMKRAQDDTRFASIEAKGDNITSFEKARRAVVASKATAKVKEEFLDFSRTAPSQLQEKAQSIFTKLSEIKDNGDRIKELSKKLPVSEVFGDRVKMDRVRFLGEYAAKYIEKANTAMTQALTHKDPLSREAKNLRRDFKTNMELADTYIKDINESYEAFARLKDKVSLKPVK